MTSYQLFTETAVNTLITQLNIFIPSIGLWFSSRIDMVVFVYAFAWVFVLSSLIPTLILGKERSVLIQFFVCLTLTLLAFVLVDAAKTYAGTSLTQLFGFASVFTNPIMAALYLSLPYILMIGVDVHSRKRNKTKKLSEKLMQTYVNSNEWTEQNYQETQ
ncbi:MAG: hypothetical protein ACPLKZ_05560 [Candidatus Bathyarchaeales archaeon]